MKNFFTRTFTSVFIFFIFAAIVATSFLNFVFEITIGLLCAVCVYELVNSLNLKSKSACILPIVYALFLPISFCFADSLKISPYYFLILITFIFIILMNLFAMKNIDKIKFNDGAALILSSVVITSFLSNIIILRHIDSHGLIYMILVIVCFAWATDVFAYIIGMLFGKHKLSPKISPKKSIEGSIGGTVFSVLITIAALYIYSVVADVQVKFGLAIIYSILCSVIGQIGDLSFSYIKRSYNIKDFGKVLPGHGGVLDRLDSTIFIVPFFCILLTFDKIIL